MTRYSDSKVPIPPDEQIQKQINVNVVILSVYNILYH